LTGPVLVVTAACVCSWVTWVWLVLPTRECLTRVVEWRQLRRVVRLTEVIAVMLGAATGWMVQLSILADTTAQSVVYAAAGGMAIGTMILLWPDRAMIRRMQGLRQRERAIQVIRGGKHGRTQLPRRGHSDP